jgi:hypothetical protein
MDEDESRIILETEEDYREAIGALDDQLHAAAVLSDNIAIVAAAIQQYEEDNNLEPVVEE